MHSPARVGLALAAFLTLAALAHAQAAAPQNAPDPHSVPVVDGALGTCTADFTLTDDAGAPVYLAKISVHIAYGFASLHKLDLEVATNVDGKARFTGLPEHLKRGLYFQAAQGDRTAVAFDDPAVTCKAQFPLTLRKPLTTTEPKQK